MAAVWVGAASVLRISYNLVHLRRDTDQSQLTRAIARYAGETPHAPTAAASPTAYTDMGAAPGD